MSHKQVIILRKDLGMRKGKMVAQGAHASMAAILSLSEDSKYEAGNKQYLKLELDERSRAWLTGNFKKICVYVNSEEELLAIHEKAKAAGIITALIKDAGLTEFGGVPTYTAVAVGPDFDNKVDTITGQLPLL
ncbi:peptidyl-tRNA hydrolase [compost metagenome]